MPTPSPYALEELAACFSAGIAPRLPELGGELLLLPNQQPVRLRAELEKLRPLPGGLRQSGVQVQWSASAGVIRAADSATSPAQAVFIPPADSQRVTLTANFMIDLVAEEITTPIRIEQPASLELLSARATAGNYDPVSGLLDGYKIGHYLDPARPQELARYNIRSTWFERYPGRYMMPAQFYKVDRQSQPLRLSPNITLGTFTIDFPWKSLNTPEGWQYIALDLNLVRKLEDLLALLQSEGVRVSTFVPIYGFRPPEFNLGTIDAHQTTTLKEPLSMHQYGRALDLIIDEDGDGQLDDLNGDGVNDVYDAGLIMHYVNVLDRQYRAQGRMEMVGGAGLYWVNDFDERNAYYRDLHPRAPNSTAYVHVDTRGFTADGGRLIRWADKDVINWPDGTPIDWGNPNKEYWTSPEHPGARPRRATGAARPARTTAPAPPAGPALPDMPLPEP